MLKCFFFLLLLLSVFLPVSARAEDQSPTRGAALMNACGACHGPEGHSQGAIPAIDAIARENMVAALRAFRTGERQCTVMTRIAKGLNDDDIAALAAYVAAKQAH